MKEFNTLEEAEKWLYTQVDDLYIDNWRAARLDEPIAMQEYNIQISQGCCGSVDEQVIIAGEVWTIGCNFGH